MHSSASSGDLVKMTIECVVAFGLCGLRLNGIILLTLICLYQSLFLISFELSFSKQILYLGIQCTIILYIGLITIAPLIILSQFKFYTSFAIFLVLILSKQSIFLYFVTGRRVLADLIQEQLLMSIPFVSNQKHHRWLL